MNNSGTHSFEPSIDTKYAWLRTAKRSQNFAGIELPGLFQTTFFERHTLGFVLIFVCEGIATWLTWAYGANLVVILLSILIDFVLAYFAHTWQKDLTIAQNERVISSAFDEKRFFEKKISSAKFNSAILKFGIGLSAVIKIYFYFRGTDMSVDDPFSLAVIFLYSLAALFHITCTGYFIAEIQYRWKIKKERDKYEDSKGGKFSTDFYEQPIETIIELDSHAVDYGKKSIVKKDDGKYYFMTKGILTDSELVELISFQKNDEKKRTIALEGIKHQIKILKKDNQ